MGYYLINRNDGRWIIYFLVSWKFNIIFFGSIFIQCWFQRILQCFFTFIKLGNELDFKSINSDGTRYWLGYRTDNNCIYMHVGNQLENNIFLNSNSNRNINLSCLQIHTLITKIFSSKASVLISQKGHNINSINQFKQSQRLRT